jgi:hypothetical protein
MKDRTYWFAERVKEVHPEFSKDPETLKMLASLEDYSFELLARDVTFAERRGSHEARA